MSPAAPKVNDGPAAAVVAEVSAEAWTAAPARADASPAPTTASAATRRSSRERITSAQRRHGHDGPGRGVAAERSGERAVGEVEDAAVLADHQITRAVAHHAG